MVMAEMVRQAESACAESAHVLASTWNLHLGLADAMTGADTIQPQCLWPDVSHLQHKMAGDL